MRAASLLHEIVSSPGRCGVHDRSELLSARRGGGKRCRGRAHHSLTAPASHCRWPSLKATLLLHAAELQGRVYKPQTPAVPVVSARTECICDHTYRSALQSLILIENYCQSSLWDFVQQCGT